MLHIASSAMSLLMCVVVLLHLVRPPTNFGALRGLGRDGGVAAVEGAPGHQQHDCMLAVSDGWWQRTTPGLQ